MKATTEKNILHEYLDLNKEGSKNFRGVTNGVS
jgi:hypothetical protein